MLEKGVGQATVRCGQSASEAALSRVVRPYDHIDAFGWRLHVEAELGGLDPAICNG